MDPKVEAFLAHHGVKGQRWGVRKARGDRSAFKKKKSSGPDLKSLSDQDLRALVSRMQLEKQYKDLSKPASKPGAKFVKNQINQHGAKVITAGVGLAATAAFQAAKRLFDFDNMVSITKLTTK